MWRRHAAVRTLSLCVVLSATTMVGCAGEGVDPSTTTTTTLGAGAGLAQIQSNIFDRSCATIGCHDALSQAGQLVLSDVATSFTELVGVTSQCGTRILVVRGDPAASYLLDKLGAGAAPCASLMPLGLPLLGGLEIQLVRSWIALGAPGAAVAVASTSSTSSSSTSSTSTTLLEWSSE